MIKIIKTIISGGVSMFRKYLLVIGVIALFLVSGCQLYEDIYGESDVSTISMDDIVVEGGDETGDEPEDTEGDVEADTETEEPEQKSILDIFRREETEDEDVIDIVIEDDVVEIPDVEFDAERAVVIIVEETDLVNLEPAAADPDGDALSYTFTSPLDDSGEWQTTYGDAGEYTVTVTASDGDLSASQDVLIIVNRKEESPTIDFVAPAETTLSIQENNIIEFAVTASDLNNDNLVYSWKLDGEEVSDTTEFTYNLDYESAGSHTVKLSITDGLLETSEIWAIAIENVNREPVMVDLDNIALLENEPVVIVIEAEDPDGDGLIYTVDSDKFEKEGNVFTWDTTYDDAGAYDVTVTVSDGDLSVSQQIKIDVGNVNRAPVFLGIEQK
jgi:PKD repeat protein